MNIKSTILKLFVALLINSFMASAQSTGFMNPAATALPSGFSNAANGMVSDNLWASVEHFSGCRCPFLFLSWDNGVTYTTVYQIAGPFDTMDTWRTVGSDTAKWGHNWVDTEFSNNNFRFKISNPSMQIFQGYSTFNFNIPTGATIDGIEVEVQWHGDSAYVTDYLNALQINVFYTSIEGIPTVTSLSNKINLFPNPAHDKVTLTTTKISNLSYSLFSTDGKIINERNIGAINSDFSTDIMLNDIPSGIYILRIISNEGIEYRKIAVQ